MNMKDILLAAVKLEATDIFIIAGLPLTLKIDGRQRRTKTDRLMPDDCLDLIMQIYDLAGLDTKNRPHADEDFSFAISRGGRFRVNVFKQRGSFAAVIRVIHFGIPNAAEIGVPESVLDFANIKNGLVLVTGPAGSGKSTTLACIIDKINHEKTRHILTLEDPIEFVYSHDRSIVTQREIGNDVDSYAVAMRSCLRESTDVVLVGELRDQETMEVTISAAEIGQLIFTTLHTLGAANAINRIIDSFSGSAQQQIRMQIALTLRGVISQQLVPDVHGELIPVFGIMRTNVAIANMIRESRLHQLNSAIMADPDMSTMDASLLNLYQAGRITADTAMEYALNTGWLKRKLDALA